jgi:maleate isomerase
MTTDTLATRERIAIVTTSVNTVTQPEMEAMRPPGVTNHVFRIGVPNFQMGADRFTQFAAKLGDDAAASIDQALGIEPGHVVLAASIDSSWSPHIAAGFDAQCRRGGAGLSTSTRAIRAALRGFNVRGQVAMLMPYSGAPADAVRRYFTELNLTVVREESLSVARSLDLARVSATTIHDALCALDGYGAEIIVQFGAALPTMRVAAEAEQELGIPVLAANSVLYWHALRSCGIDDKITGCGRLLSEL